MKAMLLAAGKGKRLGKLTSETPKPLLSVGGCPLIERHIHNLRAAGFDELVINVSYLGDKIMQALGDGSQYGVQIQWSNERPHLLGVGGGIYQARYLLGNDPWLVINADIYTDWVPTPLALADELLAYLILVDNPPNHPHGDYALQKDKVALTGERRLTFSGIGYYRRRLFERVTSPVFQLPDLLSPAIGSGLVGGSHYQGLWHDAGTPDSLKMLRARFG